MSAVDSATAQRVYRQLQQQARKQNLRTDSVLLLYLLEGLLRRLAASRHRSTFVLKGGLLLAAMGERRTTKDADFQARQLADAAAALEPALAEITAIGLHDGIDDGIEFDVASLTSVPIREDDGYQALRLGMGARIHTSKHKLSVDVSVGDPISPDPGVVSVPSMLEGVAPIEVLGYQLESVYAEKLVTALARGTASTRWRDLADVWTLSQHHTCSGDDLQQALRVVAAFRQVQLQPLLPLLSDYPDVAQAKWAAWRRKTPLTTVPPALIADVLTDLHEFSVAPLQGQASGLQWQPGTRRWAEPSA